MDSDLNFNLILILILKSMEVGVRRVWLGPLEAPTVAGLSGLPSVSESTGNLIGLYQDPRFTSGTFSVQVGIRAMALRAPIKADPYISSVPGQHCIDP